MAFGKGKEIKRLPNSEDILRHISDLEIFEMYLGGLPRKPISSPLREDIDPSFSLFHSQKHGKVLYKDFASGDVGDCFVFVMKLFNLASKIDAFNKIASDFALDEFELNSSSFSTSPKKVYVKKKKKSLPTGRLKVSVRTRPWKIRDKNYWQGKYELNINQLEYCKIFPISHYFINGYCTVALSLSYAYVEEKDGIQTFKIYQPQGDKNEKWINNNDFSTWELWTQLPDKGETLIVTSSRKDAAVIKSLFPSEIITSCSLQSEGVNPKKVVVDELKRRFKKIFVMYDNDFASSKNRGRLAGEKLSEATGFLQIEIPYKYKIKDPSDFTDVYGGEALNDLILMLIENKLKLE